MNVGAYFGPKFQMSEMIQRVKTEAGGRRECEKNAAANFGPRRRCRCCASPAANGKSPGQRVSEPDRPPHATRTTAPGRKFPSRLRRPCFWHTHSFSQQQRRSARNKGAKTTQPQEWASPSEGRTGGACSSGRSASNAATPSRAVDEGWRPHGATLRSSAVEARKEWRGPPSAGS